MGNWVDDMHRQQDEFLRKMVETWKRDERLKPFDLYFRWKTGEVSTAEWRASRDAIRQMRCDAKRLLEELWEADEQDNDMEAIVDAIDDELTTVAQIIGMFS